MWSVLSPSLSKEQSEALKTWQYDGSDPSFMAGIMKPFWQNMAHRFVPPGTSPNLVSLVGVSSIFFISIYVWTWFPTLSETDDMPFYLYFLCSLGLFIFQTADAMDGQQGRRVQMYTHPSTELVDHGCDSVTTSLIAITTALTFRLGLTWRTALFMTTVWTIFWLSTWEHIHSGTMRFPSGLSNPTEAQFVTMASFLFVGYFQHFISFPISLTAEIVVPFKTLLVIFFAIQSLTVTFSTINTISNSKKGFTSSAYWDMLPMFTIIICLWSFCLFPTQSIQQNHKMTLLITACQWNLLILKMIIAEMTKSQLNVTHAVLAQMPILLLAVGCLFQVDRLSHDGVLLFFFIISFLELWCYARKTRKSFEEVCGMENLWTTIQAWPLKMSEKSGKDQ